MHVGSERRERCGNNRMKYQIDIKRVYQSPGDGDGVRVLVDSLWPRGKRREELQLTEWYREATPSTGLRRNWHNNVIDAATFAKKYRRELHNKEESLLPLMRWARQGRLTLLTAARNPDQSHVPILKELIEEALLAEDRQDSEPASPTCFAQEKDL